ncbi:MAG: hypothetical protein RBT65_16050 [Methanolobus sp.]|nr:hypothetical protein [Methanolobus sp.]
MKSLLKKQLREVRYRITVFPQEVAKMDSLCEVYGDWPERKAEEKRALEKLEAEERELKIKLGKL